MNKIKNRNIKRFYKITIQLMQLSYDTINTNNLIDQLIIITAINKKKLINKTKQIRTCSITHSEDKS